MRSLSILLATLSILCLAGPLSAQTADTDPNAPTHLPNVATHAGNYLAGAVVAGPFDVENGPATPDIRCLGVEEAWGFYWVSGAGDGAAGSHMIHQYDHNGLYIASFPQTHVVPSSWGHRDGAADEANGLLYFGQEAGELNEYSYSAGALTHSMSYNIPGTGSTIRALCFNASGNLVTQSFSDSWYEFDLAGTVYGSGSNGTSAYGFGYDPNTGSIWVADTGATGTELDGTMTPTGDGFTTVLGGAQGGCDVYADARNPNLPANAMVMLHQTSPDSIAVYDLSNVTPPPPLYPFTVNLPLTAAPLSGGGYATGFESGALGAEWATTAVDYSGLPDVYAWCTVGTGVGRSYGLVPVYDGSYQLELGGDPAVTTGYHDVVNSAVLLLDGTGHTGAFSLEFAGYNYGEETDGSDGLWLSLDGSNWTPVAAQGNWDTMFPDNGSSMGTYDLSGPIDLQAAAALQGWDLTTGNFYLMWQQDDNYPCGYLDGMSFDAITVDSGGGPSGPTLTVTGLAAGGTVTLDVAGATAGSTVYFLYSLTGTGTVSTPYGFDIGILPPVTMAGTDTATGTGDASYSSGIPMGTTGINVHMQAVTKVGATFDTTNVVSQAIG